MATRGDLQHAGHHGVQPWTVRPDYKTYKSPHAPKYTIAPHFHGITALRATRFGMTAVGFGAVAGTIAVFFAAEIPRFSRDIMEKMPVLGSYFHKEVAPEDNPF